MTINVEKDTEKPFAYSDMESALKIVNAVEAMNKISINNRRPAVRMGIALTHSYYTIFDHHILFKLTNLLHSIHEGLKMPDLEMQVSVLLQDHWKKDSFHLLLPGFV